MNKRNRNYYPRIKKKKKIIGNRSFMQEGRNEESFRKLTQKLGLKNPENELLNIALTHPSYTFENPESGKYNNQRLEFLGDAVLDFVIGEYLYQTYPEKPEGELTKMRAAVVNETTLAVKAKDIDLGDTLYLGKGEQHSGGRERPSILADALEAVIGAVYLQYGFEEVRRFILDMLISDIEKLNEGNYGDFKTMLQERAQKEEHEATYKIIEEKGPDHDKIFTAGVFVDGILKGKGLGKTKKEAEQKAARFALEKWEGKE